LTKFPPAAVPVIEIIAPFLKVVEEVGEGGGTGVAIKAEAAWASVGLANRKETAAPKKTTQKERRYLLFICPRVVRR